MKLSTQLKIWIVIQVSLVLAVLGRALTSFAGGLNFMLSQSKTLSANDTLAVDASDSWVPLNFDNGNVFAIGISVTQNFVEAHVQ